MLTEALQRLAAEAAERGEALAAAGHDQAADRAFLISERADDLLLALTAGPETEQFATGLWAAEPMGVSGGAASI